MRVTGSLGNRDEVDGARARTPDDALDDVVVCSGEDRSHQLLGRGARQFAEYDRLVTEIEARDSRLVAALGGDQDDAPVCKSGSTTGFTCGVITAVDQPDPQRPPIRFKHTALSLPGDSGGALLSGTLAIGIISDGGIYSDPSQFPTDRPSVLPPAPPGSPSPGRILQQIGPRAFQQAGPLVGQVLPGIPQIAMIAQSVADVLDQNPGLRLRTS